MAVNIIDNLKLGTDLPLDSRYVVDSIYDVSIYWYSGMQVFQTSDSTLQWFDGSIWNIVTDSSTINSFISNIDASILDLYNTKLNSVENITIDGSASIFSSEINNIAYLKKLISGEGISISEDSSLITIAISENSNITKKYSSIFDGTTDTSISIDSITHELGDGPFNISVYDGIELVYPGIEVEANGTVNIYWSSGTMSDSCKYIIIG